MNRSLATLAMAALAPVAAHAQEAAQSPAREASLYVRGAVGAVFAGDLDQSLSYSPFYLPLVALPNAKSTRFGGDVAYAAAIGFQYPLGTRTELEYRRFSAGVDSVEYSNGLVPFGPPTGDSVDVQTLMSNAYVSLAPDARFSPYVGAGVGGAFIRNEYGERDADFAYQAKVGVEIVASPKLRFGVEGAYLRTLDLEFGPKEFVATGSVGPASTGGAFSALSVMASLRATF
jgi:opacity protein-like surface antigen